MTERNVHVVTGAFGYSGRYIAQRLLGRGESVRTITTRPRPESDPFSGLVDARPLTFDDHDRLVTSLEGASVLYNTYWVRFNHSSFSHAEAVDNTLRLFAAAKTAGVERIVHVSITNPSVESPLEYFHGKGVLEQALAESGISHAILRPTVLFGKEDILVNNIAWALRRLPVVGIFGDGSYRLQPIYVDDLAQLAVEQGEQRDNVIINAIGPESFTYRELVTTIGTIIGKRRPIIQLSPETGYAACWLIGKLVGDVFITREEIRGLMADLLYVADRPAGTTRLTDWVSCHRDTLGISYASELGRRARNNTHLKKNNP